MRCNAGGAFFMSAPAFQDMQIEKAAATLSFRALNGEKRRRSERKSFADFLVRQCLRDLRNNFHI
jgi:hypothetical protein